MKMMAVPLIGVCFCISGGKQNRQVCEDSFELPRMCLAVRKLTMLLFWLGFIMCISTLFICMLTSLWESIV